MKSTISATPVQKEKPFPKLKKATDSELIVLFAAAEAGTVVYQGDSTHGVGYHSNVWNVEKFRDYDGTVSLSND